MHLRTIDSPANCIEQSSSWEANSCSANQNSSHFMKPEDSLSFPQETATDSYPEPDESNPLYHTKYILIINSAIPLN
jgi:hypothetical protein